jgi:hypothetical protein
LRSAAAFIRPARPGLIGKDATHLPRAQGEEMRAALPIKQFEIREA